MHGSKFSPGEIAMAMKLLLGKSRILQDHTLIHAAYGSFRLTVFENHSACAVLKCGMPHEHLYEANQTSDKLLVARGRS